MKWPSFVVFTLVVAFAGFAQAQDRLPLYYGEPVRNIVRHSINVVDEVRPVRQVFYHWRERAPLRRTVWYFQDNRPVRRYVRWLLR